ncbi:hypothetical protein MYX75_02965 [Acidobacteria bacterium AH-259-A15]|nr:hypothetical protein [Acidobacteria bacterium AH-259-A15]
MKRRLNDDPEARIIAATSKAKRPMSAREIMEALKWDGGPILIKKEINQYLGQAPPKTLLRDRSYRWADLETRVVCVLRVASGPLKAGEIADVVSKQVAWKIAHESVNSCLYGPLKKQVKRQSG